MAFPDTPQITPATIAQALASYERVLVSPLTRFDLWLGGAADVLTAQEQRGFVLFDGKAECGTCHAGFAFADDNFYNIGAQDNDAGRAGVTRDEADQHRFRTPSLRELAHTAPYLHDGSAATIGAAMDAHAGIALAGEERAALLAFLGTLSGEASPFAAPPLDGNGAISWEAVPDSDLRDPPPSGGHHARP